MYCTQCSDSNWWAPNNDNHECTLHQVITAIGGHQIMTARGGVYTVHQVMTASGGGHQIMTAMGVVYTK